jgi:hypothetical protein
MVPPGHRTTRGRKRSCAVVTPLPEYGKPSRSRDGWRTSAAGPAVPPRPGSSGSRRKRTGSVPGGGSHAPRPGRRRPPRQASRVPRSSTRPGRPDGTSRAPAEAGRSSRSAAVPPRRHDRTGAICALPRPVAKHSLLNNQPGKRCAARPYTGRRRVWPLTRASRTQGWLGLVRRCAVSEAWWRRMA